MSMYARFNELCPYSLIDGDEAVNLQPLNQNGHLRYPHPSFFDSSKGLM